MKKLLFLVLSLGLVQNSLFAVDQKGIKAIRSGMKAMETIAAKYADPEQTTDDQLRKMKAKEIACDLLNGIFTGSHSLFDTLKVIDGNNKKYYSTANAGVTVALAQLC